MGYRAIQIGTVASEFEPQRFGETARRHLRRFVNDQSLEIAALLVDIGGIRFGDPARLEEGVDRTVAAIQMAAQMHVPIVTVELGPIVPEDAHVEQSLRQLAQTCDSTGTFLALQTGYTNPEEMARMIRRLGAPTVRACYDPAGLLLGGFEALSGIEPLAEQIILAYVRDAIAGRGSQSGGGRAPQGRETPLCEGELDLAEYLAALQEASYFGPLIVRRMQAMNPTAELSKAKESLESFVR
jgi:sugar phosphate isomerase/epimerase